MAVHQCARFCNNPSLVHESAVRKIAKYHTSTSTYVDLPDGNIWLTTQRIFYNPDIGKGIKCYVDTNFSSGWAQADAYNAENVM